MGVLQLGGDLDFTEEAGGSEGGGELRSEHFYCHLSPVAYILGEVDRSHAPAADFPLDQISGGEGSLETGKRVAEAGGLLSGRTGLRYVTPFPLATMHARCQSTTLRRPQA